MLIDKPIASQDIVTLKLLTGEEIIATFEKDDSNTVTVSKPSTIASNGQGMGIIPWMVTAGPRKVDLSKHAVIAMAATDPEIAKAYQDTVSEIKLA